MTSAPARLELSATDRQRLGQRAQLLADASVTYTVIEAAIAITAGVVAGRSRWSGSVSTPLSRFPLA